MNYLKEAYPEPTFEKKNSVTIMKQHNILLFGGADLFSEEEVSTTINEIESALNTFISDNEYNVKVESFYTPLDGKTIQKAYNKYKNIGLTSEFIVYGYSLGGHAANQLCKLLSQSKIRTFFSIDAATGIIGDIAFARDKLHIPENVEVNINFYQTEKSKVRSRGYPAIAINPSKTEVVNINYDHFKSENGMGAHGVMDEDTKEQVLKKIKFDLDKYYLEF
jgi:hypothetical protein